MPEESSGIDYPTVLADLRARREKLDQAIAGIEAMLGVSGTAARPDGKSLMSSQQRRNKMDIHELAKRRAATALIVETLRMANLPVDYEDRLKSDARFRLASDAALRAESEYQTAIAAMTTDELISQETLPETPQR